VKGDQPPLVLDRWGFLRFKFGAPRAAGAGGTRRRAIFHGGQAWNIDELDLLKSKKALSVTGTAADVETLRGQILGRKGRSYLHAQGAGEAPRHRAPGRRGKKLNEVQAQR